jgi:carbon-monoxide dehydrogenase large subunit
MADTEPQRDLPSGILDGDTAIGKRMPRENAKRLVAGRGRYVGDISLPRMLHLAFLRSPYAHAEIGEIDTSEAEAVPGVTHVVTGRQVAEVCAPLLGVAHHRPGHRSPPQHVMAVDKAHWQGEPVVAVLAESRAIAEDAVELLDVDWHDLPAVVDGEAALAADAPVIHAEMGDNLAMEFEIAAGDAKAAFASAHAVFEHDFHFDGQTPLSLEPRGLIADYDPSTGSITVHHSGQSPFQMQDILSEHLGIPEQKVRVICPDVGGGFGLKVNVYGDELAVAAISKIVGRPVRFLADRLEAFVSDIQSRDHVVRARMAVAADGSIAAMEMDDVAALGAFGMARRFSVAEGMMAVTMMGAPYRFENYWGRTRNVYVNKPLVGVYRGVGMPFACAAQEVLADKAAAALEMDPVAFRRQNYRRLDELPYTAPGGAKVDTASFDACLTKLTAAMDYDQLRAEQLDLREQGIWRGVGIATFIEQTAYGPPYYGPSQARISVQDGCTVKLEPSGKVRCITSITDQGQGTWIGIAQVVASSLGISVDDVEIHAGDSATSPFGGGAWASRGMAIGGEAALKASLALRANILALAGAITQADPAALAIRAGEVVNAETGMASISLAEVGRIGYFRQDTLPGDFEVELTVTHNHAHNHQLYYTANGVQGASIEVDIETGFIRLLGHWAADDCGRIINPLMVDEQVRGGVVQGLGAALYEQCLYSEDGQLQNGTMADYLAPMAAEMPDIVVEHVETPEASTRLGAKGIGEAGTIGAIGVMWSAVNDALRPLGASIHHQPFTPERVLDALDQARNGA